MTSLLAYQQQLIDAISNGSREIQTHLDTPASRLQVYITNTREALTQVLQQRYPLTRELLGETYFRQLTDYYCQHHSAHSRDLRQYGEDFPQTLETLTEKTEFNALKALPYISDIARLDLAQNQAYYAANPALWDATCFARLTPAEQQAFKLIRQPAARLLCSPWPLDRIQACLQKTDLTLNLDNEHLQQHFFLIHRPQFQAQLVSVSDKDYDAFNSLEEPTSIEHLLQQHPTVSAKLADWIEQAIVCPAYPEATA